MKHRWCRNTASRSAGAIPWLGARDRKHAVMIPLKRGLLDV